MALFGKPTFSRRILMFALFSMVKSDDSCDIEIENTLKTLLTPQEYPTMQLQALRKDMLRKFQAALDEDETNYKRSLSALARWDNLPLKRNLEALARAGYVRTLPTEDDEDPNDKRSNPKNDQPAFQINDADKRGIQSLARNGELTNRRDIEQLIEELYDKRNVARNFNFPAYGKRFLGSLVRNGDLKFGGKRNVAALLRQDDYLNNQRGEMRTESPHRSGDKRNIASIKAQNAKFRTKRQIYYGDDEFSAPVYQNQNGDDYEELMKELTGVYPNTEKRFLGSVAKTGWFRPTSRYQPPEKRHIGALARLGWLPTLRNVRRFNRSGRSTSGESCRSSAADGQAEDDAVAENSLSLEEKRFLLQPAVDRILLRKIFAHPKAFSDLS